MIEYHIHPLSHDEVMDLMRLLAKIDDTRMDEVTHLVKNADLGVKIIVDKTKKKPEDQMTEEEKIEKKAHDEMIRRRHAQLTKNAYEG